MNIGRWLFQDRRTGQIVIAQTPNALMWTVLAALALSFLVQPGRVQLAIRIVLVVTLAFWGLDEMLRGVNPWRRILGVGTLFSVVAWMIAER